MENKYFYNECGCLGNRRTVHVQRGDNLVCLVCKRVKTPPIKEHKDKMRVSKSYKGRNYRRIWVRGYFRKVEVESFEIGKRKTVRRWIKPHWRKRKIRRRKTTSRRIWR